ncbi:hypothetical protein ACFOQM_13875 [Paenibacillus sp. GCM10012307]|uniref:Uncharacterized protein n=1 Tax=Paenibacillus roseus TaxID=2798579 RepID=A0A934J019_9BACL|nr:hypothetical protein [Paenibacillus roseus]MBJ6362371.1 hypothetical protein [Paenibacillus roseus]
MIHSSDREMEQRLSYKPFHSRKFTERHMAAVEQSIRKATLAAGNHRRKRIMIPVAFVFMLILLLGSVLLINDLQNRLGLLAMWPEAWPVETKPSQKKEPLLSHDTPRNKSNLFDGTKLKVGDVIVGLTAVETNFQQTDIDNPNEVYGSATFSGEVELTGTYMIDPSSSSGFTVSFYPDADSSGKIPRLKNDTRNSWFAINNVEDAQKLLLADKGTGKATIVIENYNIQYRPSDVFNTASLIQVKSNTITSRLTPEEQERMKLWDELSKRGSLMDRPVSEQLDGLSMADLILGLKHEDNWVRWYCTYRLGELLDEGNKGQIEAAIKPMLEDEDFLVGKAATFTWSLIKGTPEADERFVPSPDRSVYAFYRYGESRFNDGKTWLLENGTAKLLYHAEAGAVYDFSWSPDSRWLAVQFGGRNWSNIELIDRHTGKEYGFTNPVKEIATAPDFGYGISLDEALRFDPWVSVAKWSGDGKRILLQYSFNDEKFNPYQGYASYNLHSKRIELLFKGEVDNPAELPADQQWMSP